MPLRVVVAGNVTLDRYGDEWLAGGSAYYAAHAWRALGASVRVLTTAGGDFPREALAGVEACVVPDAVTTRFVNEHRPDGTRTQRAVARAGRLSPASLPGGWSGCDVLHLAPVLGELDLDAWTRAAGARFVGIGVQGWVREVAAGGEVVQPAWRPEPDLLRARVAAACLGEDDLLGQQDLLELLRSSVPVVALTHGERGAEITAHARPDEATGDERPGASAGKTTFRVGVHPTTSVDPVGAGDVFSAGLFFGLARGEAPRDAARLGAAAASVVIEERAGEALCRVAEAFTRRARVP